MPLPKLLKKSLTFVFFIPLLLNAQVDSNILSKIEVGIKYSIQCPIYSINSPNDLLLPQDTRYRSRIGAGIKYYPFKRWYVEYSPSYSQQGGGYKSQRTNADYFTNSFLLGFSTLHSRLIVFNLFCGIDANFLINAKWINMETQKSENVSSYFNSFNLSFPVGMGLKTRITDNYFIGLNTYASISPYSISKEPVFKVSQIIFPAFQVSISKFLK